MPVPDNPAELNKRLLAGLRALDGPITPDRKRHDVDRTVELLGLLDVFTLAQRLRINQDVVIEPLPADHEQLRAVLQELTTIPDALVHAAADRLHQAEALLGDVDTHDPLKAVQLLLIATGRLATVHLMTPEEAGKLEMVGFGDAPMYDMVGQHLLNYVLNLVRTVADMLVELGADPA